MYISDDMRNMNGFKLIKKDEVTPQGNMDHDCFQNNHDR